MKICKAGYEVDYDEEMDSLLFIGFDGSKDTSSHKDYSSGNKIQYGLLIILNLFSVFS